MPRPVWSRGCRDRGEGEPVEEDAALLPDDGWYANFEVGEEHVVDFADRVFRYVKGDRDAHREAVTYARRSARLGRRHLSGC